MINVKPPHLSDLEVESMKKFILHYNWYSQKCPRQLLQFRKMQQFILEDQRNVTCDEDGKDFEDIVELDFIQVMLRLHQVENGQVWSKMPK